MTDDKGGSHAGQVVAVVAAIVTMVYFLVPVVFTVPLVYLDNKGVLPAEFGRTMFLPVKLLYDRIPLYGALLDAELRFCSSIGLKAN